MSKEHADNIRESYPRTYATILQRGIDQERSRVLSHLDLGTSCHAQDAALEAIRSGAEMSAEQMTAYMGMAMNHADRYRRQQESDQAEAVLAGVDTVIEESSDIGDHVVKMLKAPKNDFVRE